jgi:hypothetical protein
MSMRATDNHHDYGQWEIINLEGADKLIASIIHQCIDDLNAPAPRRGYRSARRFLSLAGLLHDGHLDTRLYAGHTRRSKRP